MRQGGVKHSTKLLWANRNAERGAVKHLTSAQVMISEFMSFSPILGFVLTAQSVELASDSVSPSLLLPCSCSVALSLPRVNKHLKNK